jgi:uncharacterized membrane protein YfcA
MVLGLLVLLVLLIGVSLGLSGIGGFLIAPLLVALAGLGPREAVVDALISFVPSGLLGAVLYSRRHSFSWSLATALSIGTVPGVIVGREISLSLDQRLLQRALAFSVMLAAGLLLVARPRGVAVARREPDSRHARSARLLLVTTIGSIGGVLTVLAGVGGPLVSVPALLLLRIDPGEAIGASLLSSVVGSGLGAFALLPAVGSPSVGILAAIIGSQVVGVTAGVLLRPRIPSARFPEFVALTGAVAAAWILWRTFS